MPLLFILLGFRFMFFSNDHEPIHIHVVRGMGEIKEYAKFTLMPDVKIVENKGLKRSELKKAQSIIEDNKEIIIDRWLQYFNNGKN
jgi:hypothetical protein